MICMGKRKKIHGSLPGPDQILNVICTVDVDQMGDVVCQVHQSITVWKDLNPSIVGNGIAGAGQVGAWGVNN